jgi:hypothetical protein
MLSQRSQKHSARIIQAVNFYGSSGFRVKKFSPQRLSAAKPQPKIGISPAKAQRPQRN